MLHSYWLREAAKIPDDRWYANYDKIVCAWGEMDERMRICAFVEGIPRGEVLVPGWQVKGLFVHLAHWCDRSRCGKCLVREVVGHGKHGWFKVDGVKQVGECRGYCEPWQCMSCLFFFLLLLRLLMFLDANACHSLTFFRRSIFTPMTPGFAAWA